MHRWTLLVLFLALPPVAAAQSSGVDTEFSPIALDAAMQAIAADTLRSHLSLLAGDALEGRGAGYPGEVKATEYIARAFSALGLEPAGEVVDGKRTYWQPFRFHPRRPSAPWAVLTSRNVAALLPGTDPDLKHEIVVLGAHHDGQGASGQADVGRRESITADGSDRIWNGANDNASGVAALLEIARALVESGVRTRRSILFLTFGAEEHGLVGSLHYTSHPLFPWERHAGMINLEMIGRNPAQRLNVRATGTSSSWKEVIEVAESATGIRVSTWTPEITNDTDHYGFAVREVPAVQLGVYASEDYHLATDTPERIAYDRLAEISRFGLALLVEVADRPERLRFTARHKRDLGIAGTSPTPAELVLLGLEGDQGGVKINAVAAGLPAYAAGVRPGDLLVEIGGRSLRSNERGLRVIAQELEKAPAGSDLPITVVRDGQRVDLHVRITH